MTPTQLRLAYDRAFTRHYRSCVDAAAATPAYLDELVRIAQEHAEGAVKGAVLLQAQPPVLVAASDAVPQETAPTVRTRTRTRRGEPA